tara:strand:+ start:325 stop:558 length:234 start_codon:yes stop_codon:yes gene_type:complete
MKKWIALGLGLTSVAVTATTMITNRVKIKNLIKPRKDKVLPETAEVTKTPVSKRPYWLPFTSGPAFTPNEDIGWVNG